MMGWGRYVTGGLASALFLALLWGARVDHLRSKHKAAREQIERQLIDAQRRAQAAFDAQIAALQTHNRRLNHAVQEQNEDLRIVYRDRVIRLPAAPAACAPSEPELSASGHAGSADGPRGDPILLERADAMICATNTARLEAARNWALEFNAADHLPQGVIAD